MCLSQVAVAIGVTDLCRRAQNFTAIRLGKGSLGQALAKTASQEYTEAQQ
jgi:hypothetical protein